MMKPMDLAAELRRVATNGSNARTIEQLHWDHDLAIQRLNVLRIRHSWFDQNPMVR